MKKKHFLFFFLLATNNLIAQTDKADNEAGFNFFSNRSKDELVYTPFGRALKSKVHFVDSGQHLNIKDGYI
jgi:hypothetical protein